MAAHSDHSSSSPANHARTAFLSWFGCGLIRKAPGTMGSLGAIPLAALIAFLLGSQALWLASILIFLAGWAAAHRHIKEVSSVKDPQWIVIDEVAGQWAALAVVPLNPVWYLAAFALFRLFDIAKPWPVSWADKRIPGALGIMLDDMLAGLYAAMILLLLQYFWANLI